jgi:hypothetical protein
MATRYVLETQPDPDGELGWTTVRDTQDAAGTVFAARDDFAELAQEFADRLNIRNLATTS